MPIYDFRCSDCGKITERIVPSTVWATVCLNHEDTSVTHPAHRMLSAPGGISVHGSVLSEQQMKKIKEPVWQYPDGHIESAC